MLFRSDSQPWAHRQLVGSRTVAIEVVKLLKEVVGGATITSFEKLLEHVEAVGRGLQESGPKGACVLLLLLLGWVSALFLGTG